jgi:hypothetical protein
MNERWKWERKAHELKYIYFKRRPICFNFEGNTAQLDKASIDDK